MLLHGAELVGDEGGGEEGGGGQAALPGQVGDGGGGRQGARPQEDCFAGRVTEPDSEPVGW